VNSKKFKRATPHWRSSRVIEAAEKQGRAAELQKELEELFNSQNKSQNATSIPAMFLRVTVAV
jgi:hypothetical protein